MECSEKLSTLEETQLEFYVERAKIEDMTSVKDMIIELSEYQNMSGGPKLTVEDLISDAGLTGGTELYQCYIVKTKNPSLENNTQLTECQKTLLRNIGFSICFPTYSTWHGKSYFIEDIFVKPNYRKKGAGTKLLFHIAKSAYSQGCVRIDFHVLNWNPAKDFYEKLGAINLTKEESWSLYRLEKRQIENILSIAK